MYLGQYIVIVVDPIDVNVLGMFATIDDAKKCILKAKIETAIKILCYNLDLNNGPPRRIRDELSLSIKEINDKLYQIDHEPSQVDYIIIYI